MYCSISAPLSKPNLVADMSIHCFALLAAVPSPLRRERELRLTVWAHHLTPANLQRGYFQRRWLLIAAEAVGSLYRLFVRTEYTIFAIPVYHLSLSLSLSLKGCTISFMDGPMDYSLVLSFECVGTCFPTQELKLVPRCIKIWYNSIKIMWTSYNFLGTWALMHSWV